MVRETKLGRLAWEHWAKHGYPVFPCSASKKPCTKNGFYDAVLGEEEVLSLFAQYPNAKCIGIPTGDLSNFGSPVDGLLVVDYDAYKQEDENVRPILDLVKSCSWVQRTKSGGYHYIFAVDKETASKIASKSIGATIDVKCRGGYIIGAPSPGYSTENINNGKLDAGRSREIAEERIPLVERSEKLVRHILSLQSPTSRTKSSTLEEQIILAEDFHNAITVLAARRQNTGEPLADTVRHIRRLMASSLAADPKHPRHERWSALTSDKGAEISRIVKSAHRKFNPESPATRLREMMKDAPSDQTPYPPNKSQSDQTFAPQEAPDDDLDLEDFTRAYFAHEAETLDIDRRFIVYPLIMDSDVVLISADPKAGKTMFGLNLAMHMAAGNPWGDMVPMDSEGNTSRLPVMYFALEGQGAVRQRVRAWLKEHPEYADDLDLVVVENSVNLTSILDRKKVVKYVQKINDILKDYGRPPIALVIFDTLTKAMPGKDQNSVEDTSEVFKVKADLDDAGLDCALMYIHHNSKAGAMRGSTNIAAEPDTIMSLSQSVKSVDGQPMTTVNVAVTMARSVDDGFNQDYIFKQVEVGKNKQGLTLYSAVLEHVKAEKDDHVRERSHQQDRSLHFYNWLCAECLTLNEPMTLDDVERRIRAADKDVRSYFASKKPMNYTRDLQADVWDAIAQSCAIDGLVLEIKTGKSRASVVLVAASKPESQTKKQA